MTDHKQLRELAEQAIAADANSPVGDATLDLLGRTGQGLLDVLDEFAAARRLHREEQRRSADRLRAALHEGGIQE